MLLLGCTGQQNLILREKTLTYTTTKHVRVNPSYPRVRYVCGEIYRLRNADACIERIEYREVNETFCHSSSTTNGHPHAVQCTEITS